MVYFILSIDGGGIRGVMPAVILGYLEERLRERAKDANATLADYFDMMAGTSTGGILTCFYLLPPAKGQQLHSRYSAANAVDFYAQRGREIFKKKLSFFGLNSEVYPAEGLERALKETMGSVTLAEARKDCLITAYDITERRATLFTRPNAQRYPHRNYLLRDVARATSAAPTYFAPAEVRSQGGTVAYLVDGAMFAGSPAICAWVEAQKYIGRQGAEATEVFILSIGTGAERKKYDYSKAKGWGLVGWARPVVDMLLSSSAEVVDYQLRQLFAANGHANSYVRIEPSLGKAKPDMDDASPANIQRLIDAANACIEENLEALDCITQKLSEKFL